MAKQIKNENYEQEELVSCLRNERVIVRFVPRPNEKITDKKHELYGRMAGQSARTISTPMLASTGTYVNVLTDKEKDFLEHIMGLEKNALSIYRKVDNYWDDSNTQGASKVILKKQDNYLNLADPEDYIKYKILLANKDLIAPSLKALEENRKATYQFVIIEEGEDTKAAKNSMNNTMMCYKEYGKVEDDIDILRHIIETVGGRPVATTSKLEFLQTKINELIQADAKKFLKVITDPTLPNKVLLRKSINIGTVVRRGDYLYLRSDGKPLCEDNQEPTLEVAAKYLNNPKHQSIKFALEAELNGKTE